ncbi:MULTISPECIES: MBOAT family O-acyltransferase [Bacteroides]|jgi:alginate O-acetyltransferase complex protein AlgI|uniref:MBOAT family protein n=1 Tax=Bacteroides intestinalis TaxID=329854 RepID=A0A139LS72_9BACE|nr:MULTISPECIES: MBOAT family O-acyltransferase [Bacteroides]KXT54321.1 MBOAT family protein [Bacteroides intestinalis]
MSFISLNFVTLFVCTFLLYYTLPPKYRKAILLLSSCIFIGYYHIAFLIIALLISLATFFLGKWVGQSKHEKDTKRIYISGLCFLITGWLAFRYANLLPGVHWLFPLGISFYTFQALSYLTEIYWKEEEPEENLADFMIYMLFFMKFLSGPIERARDMLPQLKSGKPVAYPSIVYGMKLIVVGLIKKLILADYISPYIDGIFNSIHTASGIQLLMACLLYPVELYGDFSGYTDIALGGACMLGFKLSPNFNRPFIAQTTAEFWRRWHMSLSFWVRDYLYLPLSSGMRRWGQWGVFLSLSLTFAGLGAWHGAGWNYIIYGLIQGLIIFYEMKTAMIRNKIKNWIGNPLFTTLSILRTYLLFAFSLIFFRLESVSDALYYIRNISFSTHASWKEVSIGIPDHNCIVAGSALVLILVYEYFMSKRDLLEALEKQPMLVRWSIYYLLAIMFFTLGQFNSDSFIYLQF